MLRYQCSFVGREVGAIGIFYPIVHTVESETKLDGEQIRLKLYDNFEHISELKIKPIAGLGAVRISPVGQGYKIDEIVTKDGLYITWDDFFGSKSSAEQFLIRKGYVKNEIIEHYDHVE
jgi:hypothetical protein